MALIQSISGIRGTIGGTPGENLTPHDLVAFTAAYGTWLQIEYPHQRPLRVVVGRDARLSGALVQALVTNTLVAQGITVLDAGLSTTPTVEMLVVMEEAAGGIVLTASHNPREWNALKFLNHAGEFISATAGAAILETMANAAVHYASVDQLGQVVTLDHALERHIEAILALPEVAVEQVQAADFHVVVDPINSTGALALPLLLERLGCRFTLIHGEASGDFAHNPEPLPEHLGDLAAAVVAQQAHLGIAVDPDVDRLALVCEDGSMFGEEFTLVAVADYWLQRHPGNTVSNLSSSRALRDVTLRHGGQYFASAVGEVNVVEKMKAVEASIGGEGNGGIILPALHYGRDALVGVALFLSHLATSGITASALRARYPNYQMVKDKIALSPELDLDRILAALENQFRQEEHSTIDGLKIDFANSWVHLRRSNTEPIIRIYAEAPTLAEAQALTAQLKAAVEQYL